MGQNIHYIHLPVIVFLLIIVWYNHCWNYEDIRPTIAEVGQIFNIQNSTFRDEINSYISNLTYNRDEVLAYKGESTTSTLPKKEGKKSAAGDFIVITREQKSITNGKADIGMLATNEHRTYPGSLLLANYRLIDNFPDILAVERAPIKYTVNLPGLTSDGTFQIVPSFGTYKASMNAVINRWFVKYSEHHSLNSLFQSESSLVHSKGQISVKFGINFSKISDIESSIDFEAVEKKEISVMIYKFKQIFYTVSVESPTMPADLFGPSVNRLELASKVNDKNPPVLVDSVSYGREIYVKIEATYSEYFERLLAKFDIINGDLQCTKELKNVNMQVYVIGGASQQIEILKAKSLKDIQDVIIKYGNFSYENLGYPISYACEFIKDNSRAVVKGTADYTDTTSAIYQTGFIKLVHSGGYVAQWKVEWDEFSFNSFGEKITERKYWGQNWDSVTSPFSAEIQLDGNCENIEVYVRECTGLAWEWWRTIFDRSGIALISYRTFSIWGSTLNPAFSIVPDT